VCCSAAVGAWSGKLYGLVQDLTPGDGAVDGLALGYADEQKQTDVNGNLQKLTWQFQVNPQGSGHVIWSAPRAIIEDAVDFIPPCWCVACQVVGNNQAQLRSMCGSSTSLRLCLVLTDNQWVLCCPCRCTMPRAAMPPQLT
jgi:hypothetical protein